MLSTDKAIESKNELPSAIASFNINDNSCVSPKGQWFIKTCQFVNLDFTFNIFFVYFLEKKDDGTIE